MKKSQLTLYVIIGLVIVVITAIVAIKIYRDRLDVIRTNTDADDKKLEPLKRYIEECLDSTGKEALVKLGEQGLIYSDAYINTKDAKVAYFYFKGKGYFPKDLALVEKQIARYVDENINYCISGFRRSDIFFELLDSGYSTEAVLAGRELNLTVVYPATVFSEGREFTLDRFSRKILFDFSKIYELSGEIYRKTEESPEWINLEFATQGLDIRLIKVDKATLIYEIIDSKGLDNKPYKYRFAVKYDL